MKETIRIAVIISILVNLNACEKVPAKRYAIYLQNQSPETIGCYFALGGNFGTKYPDTLLPSSNRYLIDGIKPMNRHIYDSRIKWEDIFPQLPADTLSIFIFDSDTLASYDWDAVRERYKILKRYDLSFEDLERLNRKIIFPPTEEMKDIKQFPTY